MNRDKPVIRTESLAKTYLRGTTRVEALRGVDITVWPGEYVGIMGPSGSGKSTLLHILGCLSRPTSGAYYLSGQNVSNLPDSELSLIRASRIGFVFQMFNLVPQLSVIENVSLPFLYRNGDTGSAGKVAFEALSRVGLAARAHHRPSELSGGEMQRTAIARALVVEPDLVLADEPTGNLDSKTSQGILELFRELNEQATTLVVITHDENVGGHCQRIIRLKDGLVAPPADPRHPAA